MRVHFASRLAVASTIALALAFPACSTDGQAGGGSGGDGGGSGADLAGGNPNHDGAGAAGDAAGGNGDAGGGTPDMAMMVGAVDPGMDGAKKVARFDLTVPLGGGGFNSNLATTVFAPSDDGSTLSKQGGPFPLVIVSPGFQVDRNNYAGYAHRLASQGIVAVTQAYRSAGDHTQDANDTMTLISWLLAPTGPDAMKVNGCCDAAKIGLTGHSLGGKVSFFTAEKDARIQATIGIDPVDGTKPPFGMTQPSAIAMLGSLHGASGFMGETISGSGGMFGMACAPTAENYAAFYASAASPTFAITFNGAAHMDFVDSMANCLPCNFCPGSKADPKRTHDLAVKYVTAFFRVHLLGDAAAAGYLTGAQFQTDAATMAVSEVTK